METPMFKETAVPDDAEIDTAMIADGKITTATTAIPADAKIIQAQIAAGRIRTD